MVLLELYKDVCRKVLTNKLDTPSDQDIELFLQDKDVRVFFDFISNHLPSLYYSHKQEAVDVDQLPDETVNLVQEELIKLVSKKRTKPHGLFINHLPQLPSCTEHG